MVASRHLLDKHAGLGTQSMQIDEQQEVAKLLDRHVAIRVVLQLGHRTRRPTRANGIVEKKIQPFFCTHAMPPPELPRAGPPTSLPITSTSHQPTNGAEKLGDQLTRRSLSQNLTLGPHLVNCPRILRRPRKNQENVQKCVTSHHAAHHS
jgi:hypothetical protein